MQEHEPLRTKTTYRRTHWNVFFTVDYTIPTTYKKRASEIFYSSFKRGFYPLNDLFITLLLLAVVSLKDKQEIS